MKTTYTKSLALLIMFISSSWVYGTGDLSPKEKFKKEYSEEFSVGESGKVTIKNKYGDVDIETWNQNKVKIFVEVLVYARNDKEAQEILDLIEVDIDQSGNEVSAETETESHGNWTCYKDSKYEINYTVRMPAKHELNVANKYGNVYVNELGGDMDLWLKYGSGNVTRVGGNCNVYLGYSEKFTIENVGGDLELETSYSDFRCSSAQNLTVVSKYSEFVLGDFNRVIIEGKYDDYSIRSMSSLDYQGKYDDYVIGSVGRVKSGSKYTDIRIEELHDEAIFSLQYGSLDINNVSEQASEIDIQCEYTDVDISVDHAFELDLKTKYTSYDLPDEIQAKQRIKDGNSLKLVAWARDRTPGLKIIADMRYGNLDLD